MRLIVSLVLASVFLAGCLAGLTGEYEDPHAPPADAEGVGPEYWTYQRGQFATAPNTEPWTPHPCDDVTDVSQAAPGLPPGSQNETVALVTGILGFELTDPAGEPWPGGWQWDLVGGGTVYTEGRGPDALQWRFTDALVSWQNTTQARDIVDRILDALAPPPEARLTGSLDGFRAFDSNGYNHSFRVFVVQEVEGATLGPAVLTWSKPDVAEGELELNPIRALPRDWSDIEKEGVTERAEALMACHDAQAAAASAVQAPVFTLRHDRPAWSVLLADMTATPCGRLQWTAFLDVGTGALLDVESGRLECAS